MTEEDRNTIAARRRYNRIAGIYDIMEGAVERTRYSRWRQMLWSKVEGKDILEVGVGTGKNFPYYPPNVNVTAVDFSEKMLAKAREKAAKQKLKVRLLPMDVQSLEFEDDSFDTVVGSFVFCSVPDPIRGLAEVKRVCRPTGKVVLLEHVLSANRILAGIMNLVNPLMARTVGTNINRRTVDNVARSGLVVVKVTDLAAGIFKLIEARKTPK